MGNVYEVGNRYRDSRDPSEDEFLAWIRGPLEKGISALGGVRPLYGRNEGIEDELAAIILVSSDLDRSDAENAWEDVFNLTEGWIHYWGDAKQTDQHASTVDPDSFPGNQAMRRAHQLDLEGSRHRYPPIMVFRKEEPGYVRFQGLTVIEHVEIEEFDSRGILTPNYLFHLGILDVDEVPLEWIHDRARDLSNSKAPSEWLDWIEKGSLSGNHRYSHREVADATDRSSLDIPEQGGGISGTIRRLSRDSLLQP